ncbi:hypothetical protein BDFB_009188 [Asbolus verrucosus]|uniref:RVT 1 domain containing protein n=1 Tax=Asbolus verrucosus TaxID=1661398 RepID=A0A482VLJ6_ASBVE|nr:hypothetical protein BDFB_009188 [Asbolus verrucosus]
MSYMKKHLTSPDKIIDAFGNFFQHQILNTLFIIGFNENEVINALKQIKPKCTVGSDGVSAFLIKDYACAFASPLTTIINLSIKTSIFPDV